MPLPSQLTALLEPGEEILWQSQPRPYVFMLRGLPAIFFGLTWSILGAYWYRGASMAPWEGWWNLAPSFSLPFIAAGWSFFLYPINLGTRARHTWYLVTNRRVLIARLSRRRPPELRMFSREETGAPHLIKRLDGLYELVLLRRAQERPFLVPTLESGYFGIPDGPAAATAVRQALGR